MVRFWGRPHSLIVESGVRGAAVQTDSYAVSQKGFSVLGVCLNAQGRSVLFLLPR